MFFFYKEGFGVDGLKHDNSYDAQTSAKQNKDKLIYLCTPNRSVLSKNSKADQNTLVSALNLAENNFRNINDKNATIINKSMSPSNILQSTSSAVRTYFISN